MKRDCLKGSGHTPPVLFNTHIFPLTLILTQNQLYFEKRQILKIFYEEFWGRSPDMGEWGKKLWSGCSSLRVHVLHLKIFPYLSKTLPPGYSGKCTPLQMTKCKILMQCENKISRQLYFKRKLELLRIFFFKLLLEL